MQQRPFSKLSGSSKRWAERHTSDMYVKKASAENLRARSAFKLSEIQQRKRIIRPGDFVIDLGASPGGWSVTASRLLDVTAGGKLCAVDLLPMEPIPDCTFIQGNFLSQQVQRNILEVSGDRHPDVVLSDMLHNVTGDRSTDAARSEEIFFSVLEYCQNNLQTGGNMLVKILQSGNDKEIIRESELVFQQVNFIKPAASRNASAEKYVLATRKI